MICPTCDIEMKKRENDWLCMNCFIPVPREQRRKIKGKARFKSA